MGKTEDKGMIKNLRDEEVGQVSGGEDEGKKYKGPTPAFKRPIATDYGGVRPLLLEVPRTPDPGGVAYGVKAPTPIVPKIGAEGKKSEDEE